MKKTIYLYILKETTIPFLLGMAVFTFVLLMGKLLKLAEMVFTKGVPLVDVCRLIVYMLPSFLLVSIPVAFLLAVLLAFGRLSSDSEITAMKASGVSIYALLSPVLIFAFLAYLTTTFITVYALPWGNTSFKNFLYNVIESRAAMSIREKVFNDDFPGMVMYVDGYDEASQEISGILIHDDRNPQEPSTIFAAAGKIVTNPDEKNIRLNLQNGSIHRSLPREGYRMVEFNSYDLSINLSHQAKKDGRNELDMTLSELLHHLRNPGESDKFKRDILIELHKRFALPFACFVFALIGVPLGIQNQRSGKAGGFSAGIAIIMIYYIVISAGKTIGEKGLIHPAIAMWIPNVLFICFGVHLLRKAATEQPFPLYDTLRTAVLKAKIGLENRRGQE